MRQKLERAVSKVIGAVGETVESIREPLSDVAERASDTISGVTYSTMKSLEAYVEAHPDLKRGIDATEACAAHLAGAVDRMNSHFDACVEVQIKLDETHPFRHVLEQSEGAVLAIENEKLVRVVFPDAGILSQPSHAVLASDDGALLELRHLRFHEVEILVRTPDTKTKSARVRIGVGDLAQADGPHDEKISVARIRNRDSKFLEPTDLTFNNRELIRSLTWFDLK